MGIDVDSVRERATERDEDGKLVTKTKTVEWPDGESEDIEVRPMTVGGGNKLQKHSDGLQKLEPKAVAAVLSSMSPDLEDLRADDVRDLPLDATRALVNPFMDEMPDSYADQAGNR